MIGAHERPFVMVPGGATPRGALAYVSAAFELAAQVAAKSLPEPTAIHLAVGSTCTSAGLLVGLALAQRLGLGVRAVPRVVSVRVTPWPVTSVYRIVSLAERTSALLAELSGDPRALVSRAELRQGLQVDGRELGGGYGKATRAGEEAIELFARVPGLRLDTSYSGKAAASLLRAMREGAPGPRLFWSTKSTAPLPPAPTPHTPALARWWAGA
jgi:D-cysteine desulfhydrase